MHAHYRIVIEVPNISARDGLTPNRLLLLHALQSKYTEPHGVTEERDLHTFWHWLFGRSYGVASVVGPLYGLSQGDRLSQHRGQLAILQEGLQFRQ